MLSQLFRVLVSKKYVQCLRSMMSLWWTFPDAQELREGDTIALLHLANQIEHLVYRSKQSLVGVEV